MTKVDPRSPLPLPGFAVYAPSGAISWRSVEPTRWASICAFVGNAADVDVTWTTFEEAGYVCTEILLAPALNHWPITPTAVFVNAPEPIDGSLPSVAMIAGELHVDRDSADDERIRMRLRQSDLIETRIRTYGALLAITGKPTA